MSVHVLGAGIDTLWFGLDKAIRESVFEELDQALEAKKTEGRASVDVDGLQHEVHRSGGGWQYILVLPDCWAFRLARRSPRDPAPTVQIQLRSLWLWSQGARQAADQAIDVIGSWLSSERHMETVLSRVDLALDCIGFRPRAEDVERFVRRPHFATAKWEPGETSRQRMLRAAEGTAAAAIREAREQGSDPPTDAELAKAAAAGALRGIRAAGRGSEWTTALEAADDQAAWAAYWDRQLFTGFSFGKGDQGLRLYRKDVEIVKVSKKHWFFELWAGSIPAGPERDRVLEDLAREQVWRVELQLRRPALRSFSPEVSSLQDLWENVAGLWEYYIGQWVTLRRRTYSRRGVLQRRTRWRVDEDWREVMEGWFLGPPCELVRARARELSLDHSRRTAALAVARAVALQRERYPESAAIDTQEALRAFGDDDMLRWELDHMKRTGKRWRDIVEDYEDRARRPSTVPA